MKKWISILILLFSLPSFSQEIVGKWKYKYFIYDGQEYPPSNPDLDMRFEFTQDGVSILRWQVLGQTEFCERKALYAFHTADLIYQKNVWAHPGNHMSCGSDPDMQLGRESLTPFRVLGPNLELILQLNGKPYVYIFERLVP